MPDLLLPSGAAPRHVAIIMDGNGRWASARGMPRAYGHRRGVDAVRRTVEAAPELGIRYLTLFGFSSENWSRPASEVTELLGLLRHYLHSEVAELHANGVRLRIIGDRSRFQRSLRELIDHAERVVPDEVRLTLTVALSYGGRGEITRAARRLAREAAAGRLDPDAIDEACLASALETDGVPDPDLIIRTSGEMRVSNFLLWQMAYAEMVFQNVQWPDFRREHLEAALEEFGRRERRYGAAAAGA